MSNSFSSKIIIGCSRSLSLGNSATKDEILEAWYIAVENGIGRFDTANIYAQGDSERLLGEFRSQVGAENVLVTTKAGYSHGLASDFVRLAKPILRKVLKQNKGIASRSVKIRSAVQKQNFDPKSIGIALENSLIRLGASYIDIFLLHDADVHSLQRRELGEKLESFVGAKKALRVGVSVLDEKALRVAVRTKVVSIVQLSFDLWQEVRESDLVNEALDRGIRIQVREISDRTGFSENPFEKNLHNLLEDHRVDGILVGVSRPKHMRALVDLIT